ncbi:MAG: CpsD/CapB family tyrosine-protein kinase [Paracoccaceae bacterium]
MVERLKVAIAKAREKRANVIERGLAAGSMRRGGREPDEKLWQGLEELDADPAALARERVVTHKKSDQAYVAFDMLRTRLFKLALERGWYRIGVTSATKGCGKTVVSANLGFSFARHPETRTILMDLDLRSPRLSRCLGVTERRSITWLLNGSATPEQYMQRIGSRFAVALNTQRVRDSAEVIQSANTAEVLSDINRRYTPDVVIYDLPPLLIGDDAVSFMPNLDAVILVAAAGETRPDEIEECETLLADETNLLGILLNKTEKGEGAAYYYGYGYGYGSY